MDSKMISDEEYVGLLSAEILSREFLVCAKNISSAILRCWDENKRIFVAGNGGSAAIAAHFVNDLRKFVPGGLSAFCLSDNVPYMTAIANDKDYEAIFREALVLDAQDGDLFVALSCSGTSSNIVSAIESAKTIGMQVVLLSGMDAQDPKIGQARLDHPDIRGKEDTMSILCHVVVGMVRRTMSKVSGE